MRELLDRFGFEYQADASQHEMCRDSGQYRLRAERELQ